MKKKILVIALAMAVMLMGAGYAYWSDTLTIENSIETGTFDVNFLAKSGGYPTILDERGWPHPHDYVDVDADVTDSAITLTIGNMYPGVRVITNSYAQNDGSVPAVVKNVEVTFSEDSDQALIDEMNYWFNINVNGVRVADGGGADLDTYEAKLLKALQEVRLEPGDELVLGADELQDQYSFTLPKGSTNASQDSELTMNIEIEWTQYNAIPIAEAHFPGGTAE